MIVDVTEQVKDYRDVDVFAPDGEPVLVRSLIFQALNTARPQEQLPPDESLRAGMISHAVMAREKVKFSSADVTFILERSGLVNPPLAHWRLTMILDPDRLPSDDFDADTEDGGE